MAWFMSGEIKKILILGKSSGQRLELRECFTLFQKSQTADERREPHPYQGHEGPLATTTGKMVNPLYNIFVEAAVSLGILETMISMGRIRKDLGRCQ